MSKNRIPRKLKKKIPTGPYCYKGLSFDLKTGIYHIKPCVFYTHIKVKDKPIIEDWEQEFLEHPIGWCKLIKYEIDDQCKSCGERCGY